MESKAKKIIYIILFSLLVISFVGLLILTKDSKRIVEIADFIKTDIKILYVTKDDEINYPVEILEKYDIDYLKIDSSKFSIFEIKKLKKIINNKNISNTLVIYNGGKIIDTLVEYKSEENVNEFLKKYDIIPNKIIDNIEDIMTDVTTILDNSYTMVYIPYKELEQIESQDRILKSIADKYSIDYKRIDAYLLSNNQKEKINSLLGISFVDDQILVLIKDNKMVANIRGIHSKKTYTETLYDANFINELETKIDTITYEDFEEVISNPGKSIVLIGSNDIKDSNLVFELLNKMIYNYDIEVKYIDVEKNSETYVSVKKYLEDIGYTEGFSLPLVLISESNNILDYAIGNSKEEYFLDIFIENGVIKGDVKNG